MSQEDTIKRSKMDTRYGRWLSSVVERRLCWEVVLVAYEAAGLSHVALKENRRCIGRGDRDDWEAWRTGYKCGCWSVHVLGGAEHTWRSACKRKRVEQMAEESQGLSRNVFYFAVKTCRIWWLERWLTACYTNMRANPSSDPWLPHEKSCCGIVYL